MYTLSEEHVPGHGKWCTCIGVVEIMLLHTASGHQGFCLVWYGKAQRKFPSPRRGERCLPALRGSWRVRRGWGRAMLEKEPKDPTSYPHCYASLRADLLGGSTFLHSPKPAVTSKWRMTVPRLGKNTAFLINGTSTPNSYFIRNLWVKIDSC